VSGSEKWRIASRSVFGTSFVGMVVSMPVF
jgi:hypothetical protein